MLPTTIFNVKELCKTINKVLTALATDKIDGVVLTDNAILGITAEHHVCLACDTQCANEPLYLSSMVIDEVLHSGKSYIGFEDGLNYEFYDSEADFPNPCM